VTGATVNDDASNRSVEVFSTCPQSSLPVAGPDYVEKVAEVARWSEEAGCKGILVYSDNSLVDPWLLAQVILESTSNLCPLVAIQPIYFHPYSVAKMIASFGHLYGRRIYLNMVAGGFKNDLTALNDSTPHDKRYVRLVEYTAIIKQLLNNSGPVTFHGEFYDVVNLQMAPPLASDLLPGVFLSGSSEAGIEAAHALSATAIKYPKPAKECELEPPPPDLDCGIRVGIIARGDEEEAWAIAEQRFPEDRKGQLTHQLAMKVSDSSWHRQLSEMADETRSQRNPYWLRPFENYKTFCPYLVGNYQQVAEELARYIALGYWTFVLDVPPSREDFRHIQRVFDIAARSAACAGVT
jgi:alkanesulfonate monooxygenase